jgi:hypothetical protein
LTCKQFCKTENIAKPKYLGSFKNSQILRCDCKQIENPKLLCVPDFSSPLINNPEIFHSRPARIKHLFSHDRIHVGNFTAKLAEIKFFFFLFCSSPMINGRGQGLITEKTFRRFFYNTKKKTHYKNTVKEIEDS